MSNTNKLIERVLSSACNMGWISDAEASEIRAVVTPSPANGAVGEMPKAWMRKWYADGEVPAKVKGAWPKKFKFKSVTDGNIFPDDQPLYSAEQLRAAVLAEREAAAKLCTTICKSEIAFDIAERIRART